MRRLPKIGARGASLVDYGVIVGLVALGTVAAVVSTGKEVETVFCTASNGMTQINSGEKEPGCIITPEDGITLAAGERFVDAPKQTDADFFDVVFAKGTTGAQVVLTPVPENTTEAFWFDANLISRDEYDPARSISSCYSLGDAIKTICATAGASSSISVPPKAVAFGYAVNLAADADMPWNNDASLAVPAGGGAPANNWNISVTRAEADPVFENVAFNFGPHSYQSTDEGWTYGPFATLEGKFNRTLRLDMASQSGTTRNRRLCYKATLSSDPSCSLAAPSTSMIQIDVPAGAVELGYSIELPESGPGPDWVVSERFTLVNGADVLGTEVVEITRPNPEPDNGGIAAAFASPYTYPEGASGPADGEFIALTGDRNVPLTMTMTRSLGVDYYRHACYKMAAGGEATCSPLTRSNVAISWEIPVGAAEVGYRFELPENGVGGQWEAKEQVKITGYDDVAVMDQLLEIVRPNAEPNGGTIATSFSNPYIFAADQTGVTEGEFIALSADRNIEQTFLMRRRSGASYNRRGCHKMAVDGPAICGSFVHSNSDMRYTVPVGAVEFGYEIQLPAVGVGADWTTTTLMQLSGSTGTLINSDFEIIRKNEEPTYGSVETEFTSPYSFSKNDSNWTDGEFIALTGDRNQSLNMYMYHQSGASYYRSACYKTALDGAAVCGDAKWSSSTASFTVPKEAVAVGYRANLPAPTVSTNDWTVNERIVLQGGSVQLVNQLVDIVRPNEPAESGGVASTFTSPYQYAQTDTGWTDGEFIQLTGDRNVELTMTMSERNDGNPDYYRKACWKNAAGTVTCSPSTRKGTYLSYKIPVTAVAIGYSYNLPPEAVSSGPSIYKDLIQVQGAGAVLINQTVEVQRPNEAQNNGGTVTFANNTHSFAANQEDWVENFFALSPDRNVALTFQIVGQNSTPYRSRQACHRMTAGGALTCGDVEYSGYNDNVYWTIPVGAVEAGYRYQLPAAGSAFSAEELIQVTGSGGAAPYNTWVTVTRPAN